MNFKKKWARFQKSWWFVLILCLLSIILILLSYANELIASTNTRETLKIAGQTILSSSIFLGIVKTLQYTGYFKHEINEVLFSDTFLRTLNTKNLSEKWVLLTNILHTSKFPSLNENLNKHLLERIIENRKNYTHSRMEIDFFINELDKGGKDFFKITERTEFFIYGQKDSSTVDFKLKTNIEKTDSPEDKSDLKITRLNIDGADLLSKIGPPQNEVVGGLRSISIDFIHTISKRDPFRVKVIKEIESIHTLRFNGYWTVKFETFVEDGLTINLHYDSAIFEVDLLCFGQTIILQKDENQVRFVKYRCENLIFQEDCVILLVKYK